MKHQKTTLFSFTKRIFKMNKKMLLRLCPVQTRNDLLAVKNKTSLHVFAVRV